MFGVQGVIVADAGYSLEDWCITPITGRSTTDRIQRGQVEAYNHAHSQTRMAVERFFGIFKERFKAFYNTIQIKKEEYMSNMLIAAIVINNWMRLADLGCLSSWLEDNPTWGDITEAEFRRCHVNMDAAARQLQAINGNRLSFKMAKQKAFMNHVNHHLFARHA